MNQNYSIPAELPRAHNIRESGDFSMTLREKLVGAVNRGTRNAFGVMRRDNGDLFLITQERWLPIFICGSVLRLIARPRQSARRKKTWPGESLWQMGTMLEIPPKLLCFLMETARTLFLAHLMSCSDRYLWLPGLSNRAENPPLMSWTPFFAMERALCWRTPQVISFAT